MHTNVLAAGAPLEGLQHPLHIAGFLGREDEKGKGREREREGEDELKGREGTGKGRGEKEKGKGKEGRMEKGEGIKRMERRGKESEGRWNGSHAFCFPNLGSCVS